MKKQVLTLLFLIGVLLTTLTGVALASDITGATYFGKIRASNNSTATTNVSGVVSINATAWIASGLMDSDGSDIVILDSSGSDTAFQVGYNGAVWSIWLDTVPAGSSDLTIYNNSTGGKSRYFPDTAGATVADAAGLELSDAGSITWTGVYLPSGASANLTDKSLLNIGWDGSGNVTATVPLYDFYDDFTSDAWTDVGTKIKVNTTTGHLEYESEKSATDTRSGYDIGSGIVSDTSWVMNFIISNNTSVNAAADGVIGLGSSFENDNGYAGDAVFMRIDGTTPTFRIIAYDAGGTGGGASGLISAPNGANYYPRLERTSAIQLKLSVFTDSAQTTHIAGSPVTLATAATLSGLRYVMMSNADTGASAAYEQIGWIDDIGVIYSGSTVSTTLTASGIAAGETDNVTFAIETPFVGLGVNTDFALPPVDGLQLNAPFWQSEMSSDTATTIDSNAYTLTNNGSTWSNQGRVFDGTTDYLQHTAAGWRSGDSSGSIGFWFKANADVTTSRAIVSSADEATGLVYYLTFGLRATSGKLYVGQKNNDVADSVYGDTAVNDGVWHQGWVVSNGTAYTIYLDGENDGKTVEFGADNGDWFADTPLRDSITIGALKYNSTINYFKDTISEVLYYSRALSQSEISQIYNATKSKYTSGDIYMRSTLQSITDTTDNWTFLQGVPYAENISMTQNGVQSGAWAWEYSEMFTDLSGNGNTMTPSFRTASSDADVSMSLISWSPLNKATVSGDVAITWPSFADTTDPPDAPDTTYTENATPGIFFAPLLREIWEGTGMDDFLPESIFWYVWAFGWILLVGILIFWAFAEKGQSALFIKIVIMTAIMTLFALPGPNLYGLYVVIYSVMFNFGILVLSKNYGW